METVDMKKGERLVVIITITAKCSSSKKILEMCSLKHIREISCKINLHITLYNFKHCKLKLCQPLKLRPSTLCLTGFDIGIYTQL